MHFHRQNERARKIESKKKEQKIFTRTRELAFRSRNLRKGAKISESKNRGVFWAPVVAGTRTTSFGFGCFTANSSGCELQCFSYRLVQIAYRKIRYTNCSSKFLNAFRSVPVLVFIFLFIFFG